ncbi:MAG TPA: hypothetical protein QGF58_26295 [Myxococcota bacterium]|nr:hypothetical protein [Myxococcota bacterium]
MSTTLDEAFAELRESRLTPVVLQALDFVVPGQWEDISTLDALVEDVVGEPDVAVAAKAREIFMDPERPYQKTLRIYQLVDRADQVAAGAVLANKVGGHITALSFLERFTPKPDTVQAVDAALKLVAEIVAFGLLEGRPELTREGLSELGEDLAEYVSHDRVRIAAWVVVDGVLPLGPSFVKVIGDKLTELGAGGLGDSSLFSKLGDLVPGETDEDKHGFMLKALAAAEAWVAGLVAEKGLTAEGVSEKLMSIVEGFDEGTDYLAAAIDSTTAIYRHTGTLTVARACIEDALDEVDEPDEELDAPDPELAPWHRQHRPARRGPGGPRGPRGGPPRGPRGGPPRGPRGGPGRGRRGPGRRRRRRGPPGRRRGPRDQ